MLQVFFNIFVLMSDIQEILIKHGLRKTAAREAVYKEFNKKSVALSHGDIEASLKEQFDRVTIYRTLSSFLEKGLVHKVLDDSEAAKYALCDHSCSEAHHHDNHVHFKCSNCGNSECLQDVQIPLIELPKGYTITESNLLIEGICKLCKKERR